MEPVCWLYRGASCLLQWAICVSTTLTAQVLKYIISVCWPKSLESQFIHPWRYIWTMKTSEISLHYSEIKQQALFALLLFNYYCALLTFFLSNLQEAWPLVFQVKSKLFGSSTKNMVNLLGKISLLQASSSQEKDLWFLCLFQKPLPAGKMTLKQIPTWGRVELYVNLQETALSWWSVLGVKVQPLYLPIDNLVA